jgi:hypothetical protein
MTHTERAIVSSASYLLGPGLKSQPGDQVFWRQFFYGCLSGKKAWKVP